MIGVVNGQDCEKTLRPCLKSLSGCDKIYFLDGGSNDSTIGIAKEYCADIWHNKFDETKIGMASIQKTYVLDKLKELNHIGDWIITIDADEVLSDNGILKLKKELTTNPTGVECFDIRMEHFVGNLALTDNTVPHHRTLTRVFKLTDKLYYPAGEHVHLEGVKNDESGFLVTVILFHLAYCGGIWDIKKRYDGQLKRLDAKGSHDKLFLEQWVRAHLFAMYPIREFDIRLLPQSILDEFDIDKDEIYFRDRNLEVKHFLMTKQWLEFFNCETITEIGCGKAPYGFAITKYGKKYTGYELSKFAINASYVPTLFGDITKGVVGSSDLSMAIDVLEHIEYKELDNAIKTLINASKKYILISVPMIGDPNLYNDPTHLIKEDKEWWVKQFTNQHLKLIKTPDDFLYKDQLMLFEK